MEKYTREQVKAMTQDEYESAMCDELNAAGFRSEFHGNYLEYKPDESTFGGAVVFDPKAVDYLKQIGLLDNGKCPMCSVREDDLQYKLQNQTSGAIYHVCKLCYKQYARQERAKRGCFCCLGVAVIISLVIWGIIKIIG
ncbi:MAG: hypothetical protein K6G08_08340 [Prevotella sp.]|nr:hypothetical protein [Prevotella sp.]